MKTRQDGIRQASLLELCAADDCSDIKNALLYEALENMKSEGAVLGDVSGRGTLTSRSVRSFGLRSREGLRFMWRWRDDEKTLPPELPVPENWYISRGDTDQDR